MKETLISFGIIGLVMMFVLLHLRDRMLAPFGCGSSTKTYAACMDEHRIWRNRVSIYVSCMCIVMGVVMLALFVGWLPRFPLSAIFAIYGMAAATSLFLANATMRQHIHGVGFFIGGLLWIISSGALVFIGMS